MLQIPASGTAKDFFIETEKNSGNLGPSGLDLLNPVYQAGGIRTSKTVDKTVFISL